MRATRRSFLLGACIAGVGALAGMRLGRAAGDERQLIAALRPGDAAGGEREGALHIDGATGRESETPIPPGDYGRFYAQLRDALNGAGTSRSTNTSFTNVPSLRNT